jgi:hypothetical protein
MSKGMARAIEALCFCLVLIGSCGAQNGSSGAGPVPDVASNKGVDVRPRIFQRGQSNQSAQLVLSGKASAQITTASFRPASSEELEGMEQTLEKYAAAFEKLSLPEVRQVWPALDRQHEKAFKEVFAAFRETAWTRRLGLECAAPKVTGETASVECIETLIYGKPKGKLQQAGPTRVAILLKGQSGNWVVADMKGTNGR